MSESAEPGDAGLLERSAAATTPDERAQVFGFDLASIRRASGRLRIASTAALVVGAFLISFTALIDPALDLGGALIGALLGFVAPIGVFVIAQIIVRLFSNASTSAMAIATAPVTTVLSSLLLLGAFLLAPRSDGAFAGLLLGTWAAAAIEAGGHVASARVFDQHNPHLARTARIWNEFPRWASLAFGQWGWIFVFSVLAGLTGVAALLVFRDAGVSLVTLAVIAGLALASLIEGWATARGSAWLRFAVGVLALAGLVAVWLLF
ncbi:MAG: hypothetical protein ABI566_03465 [Pseudolysinimonas sp.]